MALAHDGLCFSSEEGTERFHLFPVSIMWGGCRCLIVCAQDTADIVALFNYGNLLDSVLGLHLYIAKLLGADYYPAEDKAITVPCA